MGGPRKTGRKPNNLHVRTYIEDVVRLCETLEEDNHKRPNGVVLPPAYLSFVVEIKLYGKAILRKHAAKQTRKDIYVEAQC